MSHNIDHHFRFKKPKKEALLTQKYCEKFANEQKEEDNISMHRGVDSISSREGSKQGSILSKLSLSKKKVVQADHTSLLERENEESSDTDSYIV